MSRLLPRPFATWHAFFIHLALLSFLGGVIGEVFLTYKYGFSIYEGKKLSASNTSPPGVLLWAVRDYVMGAFLAERGATGSVHFGTGPTYLGLAGLIYWLATGRKPFYRDRLQTPKTVPLAPPHTRDDNESDATEGDGTSNPGPADYAIELKLFEEGDLMSLCGRNIWSKQRAMLIKPSGNTSRRESLRAGAQIDEDRAIHNAAIDAYSKRSKLGGHRNPAEWVGS